MIPVYQIETRTGAVLDHTITDDAVSIYTKDVLTDAVGTFTFTLPAEKGGTYIYDDIALHDKVSIYFGYNTVEATASFVGYITRINGIVTPQGYLRQFSGLSQGEILLRRLKDAEYFDATNASTIVTGIATDLSLGAGSIEADATDVTLEVRSRSTYFDLLRKVSDYWYDAVTQVKKDFYVDVSNNLIWCARDGTSPFRSGSSVETFTIGQNVLDYQITRDVRYVANNITVKGSATAFLPRDKDSWTEATTNWTLDLGDSLVANGAAKVGAVSLHAETGAAADLIRMRYTLSEPVTIETIDTISCWRDIEDSVGADGPELRLYAPDSTNYFYTYLESTIDWVFSAITLGPANIYDADENPNGEWQETGSPNWWDIQEVVFDMDFTFDNRWFLLDALYFSHDRFSATASDSGVGSSQESYGRRDLEVIDDKLHTDDDCERRAETLLYMRKDPPTQIAIRVLGNTNVLLGDRLSMTIPAEGISATNYDITQVEHYFSSDGFLTRATMRDSGNIRYGLADTPTSMMGEMRRAIRGIADDERLT